MFQPYKTTSSNISGADHSNPKSPVRTKNKRNTQTISAFGIKAISVNCADSKKMEYWKNEPYFRFSSQKVETFKGVPPPNTRSLSLYGHQHGVSISTYIVEDRATLKSDPIATIVPLAWGRYLS
jgi:hypothetical protein